MKAAPPFLTKKPTARAGRVGSRVIEQAACLLALHFPDPCLLFLSLFLPACSGLGLPAVQKTGRDMQTSKRGSERGEGSAPTTLRSMCTVPRSTRAVSWEREEGGESW